MQLLTRKVPKKFSIEQNIPFNLLEVFYNHSGYDGEGASENVSFVQAQDVLELMKLLINGLFASIKVVEITDSKQNIKIELDQSHVYMESGERVFIPWTANSHWDSIKDKFKDKVSVYPEIWTNDGLTKGEIIELLVTDRTTLYEANKSYFDEILSICEDCVNKNYLFQGGFHS
jgi:hypothetical protein